MTVRLVLHRIYENKNRVSRFWQYPEINNILPIPIRIKHPPAKAKIEKWFDTYRRFQYEFPSRDKFISGITTDLTAARI